LRAVSIVVGLRDAHAIERQAQELIERQLDHLRRYPGDNANAPLTKPDNSFGGLRKRSTDWARVAPP
jgi:hypothetical protein